MAATLSIGAAALMLGVGINTVRAWHTSGFLFPVYRTEGGRRRYDPSDVAKVMRRDVSEKPRVTIASARVSTHDQKKDEAGQPSLFFVDRTGEVRRFVRPFGPPFRRDGHRKAGNESVRTLAESSRQLS
jgi:hypothetical protein